MSSEAFVTLATNDDYGLGALVLAESIRQVGTKRSLVVLISNHLSDLIRETLETSFDEPLILVDELNSNDNEHLSLLSRPELGITFTKMNCWLLEQYSKCVFLDADCVVLQNIDDLFEREEFSAAPDAGWPDCFNSGVFVYQPSKETFTKLMIFASQQNASFDGGDQGLLNAFFSNWRTTDISRHLPFTYNVTANAFYSYLPAVTRFRNDIHIVHFAGALKPWQLTYNPENEQLSGNLGAQSDIQRDFLLSWWRVMYQQVWPKINKFNQGQFGGVFPGSLNYGNLTDNQGIELGSAAHRRAWEAGHIDYYGRDSFSNIQQQLERNITQNTQEYHPSQQRQITPEKTTTTSILKNFNKEVTPPLQQTTTNASQHLLKEATQSTNIIKSSLKESTSPLQQTTTNGSQNLLKQTTVPSTNVVQIPLKETTSSFQQTTINVPQHVVKETTSSFKQTTTNVSQNVLKESTPTPTPTNIVKTSLKETTSTFHQTTTNASQHVIKETTGSFHQTTTNVSKNVLKESAPSPTNILKTSSKETTSSSFQPTTTTTKNVPENVLKESTPSSQTIPQRENLQSLIGSTHSNEHEPSWVVKSTIVTAYTQGVGDFAGPTIVSKVVSESSATSSDTIPIKTSNKEITDSTNSSGLNLIAKTSNDHFAWPFNKLFVAITYVISLCYLLFLVAIRRSKNANIIQGNETSVRGVTSSTNNQNRVNK